MMDRFYESCLDKNRSDFSSLDYMLGRLDNLLASVNEGQKRTNLSEALGYLASNDIFPLFTLDVTQVWEGWLSMMFKQIDVERA